MYCITFQILFLKKLNYFEIKQTFYFGLRSFVCSFFLIYLTQCEKFNYFLNKHKLCRAYVKMKKKQNLILGLKLNLVSLIYIVIIINFFASINFIASRAHCIKHFFKFDYFFLFINLRFNQINAWNLLGTQSLVWDYSI